MKISMLLLVGAWGGDPTLQTDTEALVQIFFALGGPGWQNRNGNVVDFLPPSLPISLCVG